MGEKGNEKQKKLWLIIFLVIDAIILIALLIGFNAVRSGSKSSEGALSAELGEVKEQISSIVTDQEELSSKLVSLQDTVATAEASESLKSALSELQSGYAGIGEKIDGIAAGLEETETDDDTLGADIAELKKQSAENNETINAILASVQGAEADVEGVVTIDQLAAQNEELAGKLDAVLASLETEAVTEAPEADEASDLAVITNEELSDKLDVVLRAVGEVAEAVSPEAAEVLEEISEEIDDDTPVVTNDDLDAKLSEILSAVTLTGQSVKAEGAGEAVTEGEDAGETAVTLADQVSALKSEAGAQSEAISELVAAAEAQKESIGSLAQTDSDRQAQLDALKAQNQAVSDQLQDILSAASDTTVTDALGESIALLQSDIASLSERLDAVAESVTGSDGVDQKLSTIHNTIVDWRESEAAETETDPVIEYVVKKGDTLLSICNAKGINYYENKELLKELNEKEDLGLIEPGETLLLPDAGKKKK